MPRPEKPEISVPSYEFLSSCLLDIPVGKWRKFFTMIYLTGARISERPIYWNSKGKIGVDSYILVTIHTRKNPTQKKRTVPVSYEHEEQLAKQLLAYLFDIDEDPEAYDYTIPYLERVYKRYLEPSLPETYPHFLREFRIHHVVSEPERLGLRPYREDQLCQYFGWSNWDSARPYRHLRITSLI